VRYIAAFLVALAVGALTVSGDDRADAELAELHAAIAKVRAGLEKRIAARAAAPRLELRLHDVRDLVQRDWDEWLPVSDLRPSSGRSYRSDVADDGEPGPEFEVDMLIEVIQSVARPPSWDMVADAAIEPAYATLFVTAESAVQEEAVQILNLLRRTRAPMLAVEIVAVPAKDGDLARLSDTQRVLPRDLAEELLARPALGVARTIGRSGFAKVQRHGRLVSYVCKSRERISKNRSRHSSPNTATSSCPRSP